MRTISARPAGPFGSVLAVLLGALALGAALLVGAVVLALILGLAARAVAGGAVRLWWARRRASRTAQTRDHQARAGVIIEGEYRRHETGTSRRQTR